ncbi:MAG: hypothetical protein CL696_12185 [Chloroflexi bacterium]|jgi:hypothetical protein|nr:hypothetical protein [Chloroflexota bacterium]MDP6498760.1 hypothetical protein [Dehalococcoidia bacterium]MQG55945.1 hypothetical protein [SAR202 cluster bacterium]
MAGKSRRTASRQSQLKRKKNTKGPSGIPSGRRVATPVDENEPVAVPAGVEQDEFDAEAMEEAEAAVAPRPSRPSPVARTPRGEFAGQGRLRGERPAAYLYVGAEFRRISVLASAMIGALVVLGIVL